MKEQYDGYVAIDDVHVNGKLTLGENIADLGGVKLAHAAMATSGSKRKPTPTKTDDFTVDSSSSSASRSRGARKMRPETARLRAATDPHSPPYRRVNGPLSNLDAFQRAFSCGDAAPMHRTGRRALRGLVTVLASRSCSSQADAGAVRPTRLAHRARCPACGPRDGAVDRAGVLGRVDGPQILVRSKACLRGSG